MDRAVQKAERDQLNKEMTGKRPSREELQRAAAVRAQVKKDLETLQEHYNQLLTLLQNNVRPDIAAIDEIAGMVNKHAESLKANLKLPVPGPAAESDEKLAEASGTFRSLSSRLCVTLYAFLTDPFLDTLSVVDVEKSEKAGLVLEELIRLSEQVRERARTAK
jgi:hypothetical protein